MKIRTYFCGDYFLNITKTKEYFLCRKVLFCFKGVFLFHEPIILK